MTVDSGNSLETQDDAPKYTIAICNYNMVETLEQSLRSVLDQIDDRFEVLVVDDGSTDASPELLSDLATEYDRLRLVLLSHNPDRHLGETRNISVERSRGEYVILHVDTDDEYVDGIFDDFVYIFHQIENALDQDVAIQIPGMRMAHRELWTDYGPYRNLPVGGEDMDLWRRLLADNRLIYIDAIRPHRSIGYDKDRYRLLKRWYRVAVSDFQSGVSPWSYVEWTLANHSIKRIFVTLAMLPLAYYRASQRDSFHVAPEFHTKGTLPRRIGEAKHSLTELEAELGISIDRSELSTRTRYLFDPDHT